MKSAFQRRRQEEKGQFISQWRANFLARFRYKNTNSEEWLGLAAQSGKPN
ncbi:MAG: hypothetical protein SW833_11685 [Cyanobacteriota bacterium]|nr:hypothetical protein [Cyanobacteriota bacterium]